MCPIEYFFVKTGKEHGDVLPHPQGLGPLFTGQWNVYAQNPDSSSHLFGTSQGAGTAILTLLGGFHPQTQSLWLTDMAHHHLAIAFLFLIAGHMYRTNFGIGHSMKDLLDAHIPPGGRLGRGHKGLYDTINNSLHFQLGLALASFELRDYVWGSMRCHECRSLIIVGMCSGHVHAYSNPSGHTL